MGLPSLTPQQRAVLTADYLSRQVPGKQGYEIEYAVTGELLLWPWFRPVDSQRKVRHGEPISFEEGVFHHRDGDLVNELTLTYETLELLLLEEEEARSASDSN